MPGLRQGREHAGEEGQYRERRQHAPQPRHAEQERAAGGHGGRKKDAVDPAPGVHRRHHEQCTGGGARQIRCVEQGAGPREALEETGDGEPAGGERYDCQRDVDPRADAGEAGRLQDRQRQDQRDGGDEAQSVGEATHPDCALSHCCTESRVDEPTDAQSEHRRRDDCEHEVVAEHDREDARERDLEDDRVPLRRQDREWLTASPPSSWPSESRLAPVWVRSEA